MNFKKDKRLIAYLLLLLFTLLLVSIKPFLIKNVIKQLLILLLIFYLYNYEKKNYGKLIKLLNISIIILTIYGLFQYICLLIDKRDFAIFLHSSFESFGYTSAAIRMGIPRVSSLVYEPSHLSFIVGVYFFITNNKFIRILCILCLIMSVSYTTLYAFSAYLLYIIFKKLKLNFFIVGYTTLIIHIFIAIYFVNEIPSEYQHTFIHRYIGIIKLISNNNIFEYLFGSFTVNSNFPNYILNTPSNVSSVFFLLGIIGYSLYLYIYHCIEETSKLSQATAIMFFYGICAYYLMTWPIYIIFLTLVVFYSTKNSDLSV